MAPLTTGSHIYPFRISCRFKGRQGHIILDQLRTVDQERLVQQLGSIVSATLERALTTLQEMVAP